MSRRVQLYVGGRPADLSDGSPIQWTWTREELDNPTVVRNSYTHQLTLPGTPANDAIFGSFQRVDRAYAEVVGESTGIAFNPLKKAPFALYDERSEVLARGYLKLDAIESRGEQAHGYKVTLYGGLGSLFYDLEMTAEGSKRTLADLIYVNGNAEDVEPESETMAVTRDTLMLLWDSSYLGVRPKWQGIVDFAPCYNGLPEGEFDANKAIVSSTDWYNFPTPVDGCNPLGGSGTPILATFQNRHTEWEMRDLRCWLQRPVVSVKAVLEALTDPRNTGDWSLALDGAFFTAGTNPWYDDAWMTLPLLKKGEGQAWATLTLADALRGSCTPAAFLIGYAKTFGLVFDVDEAAMTVTLRTRDDYYDGGNLYDLTDRADRRDVDIRPVNASSRWYEMKAAAVGEYAKEYETTYGRVYGSQRIDTGWEFDGDVKDLLGGYPFRGAADVLETSALFYENYYSSYGTKYGLAVVDQETVKYQLFDGSGNARDFDAYVGQYLSKTQNWYNAGAHGSDVFAKPQLHGADGKAEDGAGVLVIRTGDEALPGTMHWRVSQDSQAMEDLNGGRPCWLLSGQSGVDYTSITKLPSYRRMAGSLTMDFGAPREVAVPGEGVSEGATIYFNRWKGYLADRLDVDTKVLTAKVDLRGLDVGPALLRDMWWWRSALWSLNRIKDYTPDRDGLTECEFVQVHDADAYTQSQAVPEMESWYLNASPLSLSFLAAGESKVVTITSNVAWTLTIPSPMNGWLSADKSSGTGNDTVVLTASSNAGAVRSGTVALSGAHSTSASVGITQQTSFTPSISIEPQVRTYDNQARTFYWQISCNGAWSCTGNTSGGWLICNSSGSGNGVATIQTTTHTGNSNRTAVLTFSMTDYPAVTCTATITQTPAAQAKTYALELGASSHVLPAGGGSYVLTVQGVTYTNGVETSRVNLSASDLTVVKSGSAAISRSGLTFSASDLGTTPTSAVQAVFQLTWTLNGAATSFTCSQEANSSTVTYTSNAYTPAQGAVVWNASGTTVAKATGDYKILNPSITIVQTQTRTWTSGAYSYDTVTFTDSGTWTVSGTGLSEADNRIVWASNGNPEQRTGTLTLKYGADTAGTWALTQAAAQVTPTKLTVTWRSGMLSNTEDTVSRTVYGTYVRWTLSGGDTVYSTLYPVQGDNVYTTSALSTVFGRITAVTY